MIQIRFLISIGLIGLMLTSCGAFNSNTRGKAVDLEPESVAAISFDTIKSLMIVDAEINGHKGKFLFDNGFTLSAVSPGFAEKAGIEFGQSTRVNDINNKKLSLEETTISSIIIGDMEFKNTGFYKIDTKKFFPCDNIDGVIGGSIINKVNWNVDYPERSIAVSKLPFELPQNNSSVIDVEFNGGNSAMTVLTLQEKDIVFKIDIGMSGEMAIRKSEFGDLYAGFDAIKVDGISSLGATGLGNIENNYELAKRVNVGNGQNTLPVPAELELEQSQKYDGYVGVGYLKYYNFILNSTENQYILAKPNAPEENPIFNYGINMFIIDDTCRIIQKNGFDPLLTDVALMSIVTTIDGVKTSEFRSVCDLREFMRKKYREKSELVLQIGDNEEPLVLPYREAVTGNIE